MVIKEIYNFKDGRVGTKHYSDKLYKTTEVEELNEQGELVKIQRDVYYYIKNTTTNAVYSEAIDILPYNYVELTDDEMKQELEEIMEE